MDRKIGFTCLVKAFRKNQSPAKHSQSPSRFLLTEHRFAGPSAFTLAEVLITLSILGVVAGLTIPNMIRKVQDKQQVVAFLKIYSTLNTAFDIAIAENGTLDTWQWPYTSDGAYSPENGDFIGNVLKNYLNVKKYCGSSNECWSYLKDDKLQGVSGNITYFRNGWKGGKMILKDGTTLAFDMNGIYALISQTKGTDASVSVDINVSKGPNRVGYDIFSISFNKNGLTKYGNYWGSNVNSCNPKAYINEGTKDGAGCTYWILKHKNMDYKYRDISNEW